jgi:hypothetical protein
MNSPQTDAAGQPAEHTLHRGICSPSISSNYRTQAWFYGIEKRGDVFGIDPHSSGLGAQASVFRFTTLPFAELDLKRPGLGQFTICLRSPQLRELAARLLDAAHDLDTYAAGTDREPTDIDDEAAV